MGVCQRGDQLVGLKHRCNEQRGDLLKANHVDLERFGKGTVGAPRGSRIPDLKKKAKNIVLRCFATVVGGHTTLGVHCSVRRTPFRSSMRLQF